jgi:hypothetical protein
VLGAFLAGSALASAESDSAEVRDLVDCTVFAPTSVRPGEIVLVQVFVHLAEQTEDARAIATELVPGTVRREFRCLEEAVARGARLTFELNLAGAELASRQESLTWRGRAEHVTFFARLPKGLGSAPLATVWVTLDGAPLGHLKFTLALDPAAPSPVVSQEPVGEVARRYEQAFVSYASQDRDEVLRRVQMLRALGVKYFSDLLDLEPGDEWWPTLEQAIDSSDLFLLFWSSQAKSSKWVRREVLHALSRNCGDGLLPPEIRPVILEGPPIPKPWEELAHIHFNDKLLYFMLPGFRKRTRAPRRGVPGPVELGRHCPYCRFPIKRHADIVWCPSCDAVHHIECWVDSDGCAVLGCSHGPGAT